MVRETRHLWVGNLPDNIREDRIREHFKRYGRVQNVKLLGRAENSSTVTNATIGSGVCATVAFMDIKSASKAHTAEHVLDDRTLTTEYYEPAAIPSSATGAPSAGSSPAGSGYSGSSSSVNSAPVPTPPTRYHLSSVDDGTAAACAAAAVAAPATWRGTNDSATDLCRRGNTPATYGRYQRNNNNNNNTPYSTPPSNIDRTPLHRWYTSNAGGGESTPSTPGGTTDAGVRRRRRSGSGGGSSRSDSSSPEPSDESRCSTSPVPASATTPGGNTPHQTNHRSSQSHQWASTASGRPLAICVRNLPTRSTDSSLKDGLYHEYKKHGKVVWVKVVGQNAERYAIVRFKKPSDVEKALEVSQDKLFFGCKISVAPHQSCEEDAESAKPYETDIDEYHPKATRTLFIGNLEKDVTQQQLRDKFKHFGRIIEIDIKKGSGGGAGYAFCQYASISSVVEAIRAMDGEYVGSSRVKLGFGKPVATTCVWVDGLTEHTEKQVLGAVSRSGAATSVCVDRAAGAALVHFEQASAAGAAVRELRRLAAHATAADPVQPRLCVDYASRECQEAFYEQLEKHGGNATLAGSERLTGELASRYAPSTRHENLRYENVGSRSRASSYGRGSSRTPRYSTLEHYDPTEYAADRRYRVYDELGSSPQTEETSYEDRLQSVVVSPHRSRRHRRDSSPELKEWHRSVSGGVVSVVGRRASGEARHRSRSGSRRRHRRRRDESLSRGGTPLRDEPELPPAEPRRPPPPRDRSQPMSLPLPKFALLLRPSHAPPSPEPEPQPPASPARPPPPDRPPSASSSSAGSAPHSPSLSLEERIRSLDEKYERWSRLDPPPVQPAEQRTRLRHHLLEVDIHEVKPSEVVKSLLAKRSVFDEDSERLEGTVLQRPPSPAGSPQPRPRTLQYPFPTHSTLDHEIDDRQPPNGMKIARDQDPPKSDKKCVDHVNIKTELDERLPRISNKIEALDNTLDPRIDCNEKVVPSEKLNNQFNDSQLRLRMRTPSIDKTINDSIDKSNSPKTDKDTLIHEHDSSEGDTDRRKTLASLADKEMTERISIAIKNEDVNNVCCIENNVLNSSDDKKNTDIETVSNKHCYSRNSEDLSTGIDSKVEHKISDKLNKSLVNPDDFHDMGKTIKIEHDDPCSTIDEEIAKICEYHSKQIEEKPSLSLKDQTIPDPVKSKEITDDKTSPVENIHHEFSTNNKNKFDSNTKKVKSESLEVNTVILKSVDKNTKERLSTCSLFSSLQKSKTETENQSDKFERINNYSVGSYKNTVTDLAKTTVEEDTKTDKDEKIKSCKETSEKDKSDHDKEKNRTNKNDRDKLNEKDRDKKNKVNLFDVMHTVKQEKNKNDKEHQKHEKDHDKGHKTDREHDNKKHHDEKPSRHDHHKKDKYDKRKDSTDSSESKTKREEKHKHDRHRNNHGENKKDQKREDSKSRKSSRDESVRDLCRKDSTDSSASRASYDSNKLKETEDIKEDLRAKPKICHDKYKSDKESSKPVEHSKAVDHKFKTEVKEEKCHETISKSKAEQAEKPRHYSLDSPSIENKRKERLNSSSSLPSHIGHKRRMSSQDSFESLVDENKRNKNENKISERRDSKETRSEKHKTPKFNKCHFAKLLESKVKDEKKNQVKPPDESSGSEYKEQVKETKLFDKNRVIKKSPKYEAEEKINLNNEIKTESLQNDLDFLETLKLEVKSEEDEKQKALRKEMKEKKRLQQLQQIQELIQQDVLQAEIMNKMKDDKKFKIEEKRKESAREKRMSTERKSRDEKERCDSSKRKSKKHIQSSDTSDSDEPKKHSIFDIVDDEPTYISMYDKVKARSCKNMQKQEEEKRQEKIKAKFCQLKQSRAKREEKKRSSWDEDSDSEHDRKKSQKASVDTSSDEDSNQLNLSKKHDKICDRSIFDFDYVKNYYSYEEDSRNKMSRKNSRSRIMSDTSDDDNLKRIVNKSPIYSHGKIDLQTSIFSDSESLPMDLHRPSYYSKQSSGDGILTKDISGDKIKKNSLRNLFGKSDSDESKIKSCPDENELDFKRKISKKINDFSSESESMASNLYNEIRKKHKKKQKKSKFVFSDEDTKINSLDSLSTEIEIKHRHEKNRRHSNKKEKRKEKIRESFDTDESRGDDKLKTLKTKQTCEPTDCITTKKDGKMEDIFGPLSDESDSVVKKPVEVKSVLSNDFESNFLLSATMTHDEKLKEKDENKRKKEKRRKEKRHFAKDDDNSLDVDAVSKAIEAQLFADSCVDEDVSKGNDVKENTVFTFSKDCTMDERKNHHDKYRRDKDKRRKKKRSKEERQNRKEYHVSLEKQKVHEPHELLPHKAVCDDFPKLIDKNTDITENTQMEIDTDKVVVDLSPSQSPSLPRLMESPPVINDAELNNVSSDISGELTIVEEMEISYDDKEIIEIKDHIPLDTSSPINVSTSECNPSSSLPVVEKTKCENIVPSFDIEKDQDSENAVRSISNFKDDTIKTSSTDQTLVPVKTDDKTEEKPRAVISQEETEDAVAALLGESFGGNDLDFSFEDTDQNTEQLDSSTVESENMPEEDAEEMRRAVQNLNASEMELKPDTPMSENDLLLIDTDTEEADETPQDVTDKLPVNIIATNPMLNSDIEHCKRNPVNAFSTPKTKIEEKISIKTDYNEKLTDKDSNLMQITKETNHPSTSAPTPVITSWTLTNNKLREPQLLNITKPLTPRDSNENKINVTGSIIQLKASQGQSIVQSSTCRPILTTPNRINAPYQVINQMIKPPTPNNMQPPSIKIPEPHILYQKAQGIVLSPRMTVDSRLQSPKGLNQGDSLTSPRLANMAILTSTSPQNLNSVGLGSPNNMQQRSPSHVTVVRMQQPPLSPIHATVHLPPGTRAMVSPNRSSSVLVQTQGTPIHFNRLPVTPLLTPISKQINQTSIVQQNKALGSISSPVLQQQLPITIDGRKIDSRTETPVEKTKIILTPTSLQQSTNPTVMAQNRLISMQNALHVSNINSSLKLSNKLLIKNANPVAERKETNMLYNQEVPKSESSIPFTSSPVIHVNHSTGPIIQSTIKPIMHEQINREQSSNVIHNLNSQRLLTTANVIQIDPKKVSSVLSMAGIRAPTVLTKIDSSKSIVASTSTLTNVVMTPLLVKTSLPVNTVRVNCRQDQVENNPSAFPIPEKSDEKKSDNVISGVNLESIDKTKEIIVNLNSNQTLASDEKNNKCENSIKELLKSTNNDGKMNTVLKNEKHIDAKVNEMVHKLITSSNNSIVKDNKSLTKQSAFNLSSTDVVTTYTEDPFLPKSQLPTKSDMEITVSSELQKDLLKISSKKSALDFENVEKSLDMRGSPKDDDKPLSSFLSEKADDLKKLSENDSWSAKDVNIESVIKKVDSLCYDNMDDTINSSISLNSNTSKTELSTSDSLSSKSIDSNLNVDETIAYSDISEKNTVSSKRGGRSVRGKKGGKAPDRVQTRQISKPARGGGTKRGRGRMSTDKKIKNAVNTTINNIPGDIYDFHEDSGDETNNSSSTKTEPRPRLILTIKSPLSGHNSAVTSSTLTITPKEQPKPDTKEKVASQNKEEKIDDFASPSLNTRKSRRLQEKDVQRTTDDVTDEVTKSGAPTRGGKDCNKKRLTRQISAKVNYQEKAPITTSDARKSPRGVKRTRDRSLSDTSVDSSDEKVCKKEEIQREIKMPKLADTPPAPTPLPIKEPETATAKANNTPVINTPHVATPMPIMKPPKKMILASAFESSASASVTAAPTPTLADKLDSEPTSNILGLEADEPLAVYRKTEERRMMEAAPGNALPPGAERVQSPALPHRPPSAPAVASRPAAADRATPVLMRAGEGACASGYRAAYAGTASLPRGAHHPPPPPHPHHLPHRLPHLKGAGTTARMNVTSLPNISPQGQISLGDGMYPHFSRQHYQMFQQHFHATQHDNRASPSPYTRALEAEGSETPAPPLELRRPTTTTAAARVPRPAHSPASSDRLIMYGVVGGRSPPPAHVGRGGSALPPPAAPGPPHASQVPREADSLQMLLRRYPVMWQGLLALKNDCAVVQMHFVGGNPCVAGDTLPRHTDGSTPPLRIAQRMRLEPQQLDQVHRKMKMENEHCTLLALPCGRDHMDVLQQSTNLTSGFITYLQRKQAAGIVNVAPPGHHQAMYTVHIFPSCDFANENLNRIAPDLMHRVADIAHLLIVIATV